MKIKYLKFRQVFAFGAIALTVLTSCDGNDDPEPLPVVEKDFQLAFASGDRKSVV